MAQFNVPSTRDPIDSLRDQLKQKPGLPFLELRSRSLVEAACRHCNHQWRKRLYTPWITLGLFLSQILSDDQSCDDAVDRFQKFLYDQGLPAVATETTSYAEARPRLPETLPWELVRRTGHVIPQQACDCWLFHGRAVKILDGSTVRMPDTPENQAAYPQPSSQTPGLGFPIARILVIFSLAVGTVLDAALGPYQGKQTSELALLRQIIAEFQPGDIALADRCFCSYGVIAALLARQRCGGASAPVPQGRLPPGPPTGSRGSSHHLAETQGDPRLEESRPVRRDARGTDVARVPRPGQRPDQAGPHSGGCDDTGGGEEVSIRRAGEFVPSAVGCGIGSAFLEDSDEDGDVADEEPGDGAQGGGGASAGVQLDPGSEGGGGAGRGSAAAAAKLHGVVAYGVRIRGESSVGSGSDQGGSSAAVGVDREGNAWTLARTGTSRAVKRRPKPHPLLRMPRKRAKRLIKRGIIPYNKA